MISFFGGIEPKRIMCYMNARRTAMKIMKKKLQKNIMLIFFYKSRKMRKFCKYEMMTIESLTS